MIPYRTIAGIGAAALVFIALTRINRHLGQQTGQYAEKYAKGAALRVKGYIRKREDVGSELSGATDDVI